MGGLQISKRRFALTAGAGFAALTVLIVTLFLTGTLFAAFPITGVGGFVIAADKITGDKFQLWPAIGETEQKSVWPQAAIDLGTATIQKLNLWKDLDTSGPLGSYGIYKVKVVVGANGDVTGSGLKLRVSGLTAESASFSNLDIKEHYTNPYNPLYVLSLEAPSLELTKPELNTHSLIANSITIPGLFIKILAYDSSGNLIGGSF